MRSIHALLLSFYFTRLNGYWLGNIKWKGGLKLKKNQSNTENTPTFAEGIDTEDELQRDATSAEIDKGEYTQVTTLSLDENDPS